MATDMTVANTILATLGGKRFILMTGANRFVGHQDGLGFRLPSTRNYVRNGYNIVRITLTPMDLYKIEFIKFVGMKTVREDVVDGIYADMLVEVFEEYTGLLTKL